MITVKQVKKQYRDFQLDLSMELPEGRVTGLVGKNGAGKSTVLRLILGLAKPDEGSVSVFGTESRNLGVQEKERIGVSMPGSGFSGFLTGNDIWKILKKMYRNFDEERFETLCRKFQVPMEKQISQYSTGMRAKMKILIAVTHQADLLILDEPTAGLDAEARRQILDLLRAYLAERDNRSLLITSHIASDLEGLCDDIYLIHNGSIVMHEDTDTILDQYAVIKLDEEQYRNIDKRFLLKTRKEAYGYSCLTAEKQYYAENYPGLAIEKSGIDGMILMMTGGTEA